MTYTETPTSEEQPRKQMKSALNQEISEFNPSSQMNMEQLIKVVLNLQEEVQKLKHLNKKLILKLEEKNEMDESCIDNYERQMDAFYNMQNHQDMNDHAEGSSYEIRIGNSTPQRIKNGTTEYWIDPNGCRTLSITSDETNPDQEEMLLLWKPTTSLSKLSKVPIEATGFLISKANKKIQIEKFFCNKNGNMYKKKKIAKIKI